MLFGGLGFPAIVDTSNLAQFPAAVSALGPSLGGLGGLSGLSGLGGLGGLGTLGGLGGLGGLTGLGGLGGLGGLTGVGGLGGLGTLGGLGGLGIATPLTNTLANRNLVIPFSALSINPGFGGFGVPFGI